jgi:hypothetical protein
MPWSVDTTDTPANVNTTLTNLLNNLSGIERGFFNNIRTNIALQLSLVTTATVRVVTTGVFDGIHWRASLNIDPVNVSPPNVIIQQL